MFIHAERIFFFVSLNELYIQQHALKIFYAKLRSLIKFILFVRALNFSMFIVRIDEKKKFRNSFTYDQKKKKHFLVGTQLYHPKSIFYILSNCALTGLLQLLTAKST